MRVLNHFHHPNENMQMLAPMGVLTFVSACPQQSGQPTIKTSGHFYTCMQSHLETFYPTAQKSYPKFRNPRTTLASSIFLSILTNHTTKVELCS